MKAVLRGQFIALNVYNWESERPTIKNLSLYLKKLEKWLQSKQKKELNKGKSNGQRDWNQGNYREKAMKLKADSLNKKINKIDKPLERMTKIKRPDTNYWYQKWNRISL